MFHHQQGGDVVVDGEDGVHLPRPIPDVDGGGLEDLAVRGAGEIGQVVLGVLIPVEDLLHHHRGGPVPQPAPGDMPVFNVRDGLLRVLGGQVVDHHFGAALLAQLFGKLLHGLFGVAELGGQGGRNLLEHLHPAAVQCAITSLAVKHLYSWRSGGLSNPSYQHCRRIARTFQKVF